ncbi:MAG: EpsI family protein [Deltaproteobacteria bacterium]|nr:MAG: EpsI family protein [Deltaproteobacteria bacterium]
MAKWLVALAFIALNFYAYHYFANEVVIPPRSEFSGFPETIVDWTCVDREEISKDVIRNLGASDYLLCTYENTELDEEVNVYIGYHETQVRKEGGGGGENSIHPPEHCIPGSGWDIIDLRVVDMDLPGLPGSPGEAKRAVIAHGDARQLTYFWYQSQGRVLARNHEVILYRMWDRATRHRTDGALMRFTVPIHDGDIEEAESAFWDLAGKIAPRIERYVPL